MPSATTEGRGGIVVLGAQTVITPPEQWDIVAWSGTSTSYAQLVSIMCRADLPAGETTWSFSTIDGSNGSWAWVVEEWTNLSFAPIAADSGQTTLVVDPTSISSGSTGTTEAPYVMLVAAALLQGGSTAAVWPASASWSNGFTETDVVTLGTGQAAGDLQLRVARYYGTLGEVGPWSTTCTYPAAQTNKTAYACIAAFRAENWAGDI